jgi:hypothetical protein
VALWRLPRPDFRRLVDTDFQDTLLTLWPARSRSRHATLSIESSDSFVASAAASIATGWSEPVPGRDFPPLKSSAFHDAHFQQLTNSSSRLRRDPAIKENADKTRAILNRYR